MGILTIWFLVFYWPLVQKRWELMIIKENPYSMLEIVDTIKDVLQEDWFGYKKNNLHVPQLYLI